MEVIEYIEKSSPQFIEANTSEVSLNELREKCVIPVFAKDNESTISHPQFIDTVVDAVKKALPSERVLSPAVRVSHPVKGRIPEAIGKPVKELLEHEKTVYYERMAFIVEVGTMTREIDGQTLSLTIGGVRAYNHDNLYGKKTEEKFQLFVGVKNWVCCNLCISTDGFKKELRARNASEITEVVAGMIASFDIDGEVDRLQRLKSVNLSEYEFAQFLGRARMLQHLPKQERFGNPEILLGDSQLNAVAEGYYRDPNFSRSESGSISLWNVYNLMTGSLKKNYIDTLLEREVNCFSTAEVLMEPNWLLS